MLPTMSTTGIEIEINDAPVILQAHVAIILTENLFVLFFTFELAVRFGAFRRRLDMTRHLENSATKA